METNFNQLLARHLTYKSSKEGERKVLTVSDRLFRPLYIDVSTNINSKAHRSIKRDFTVLTFSNIFLFIQENRLVRYVCIK